MTIKTEVNDDGNARAQSRSQTGAPPAMSPAVFSLLRTQLQGPGWGVSSTSGNTPRLILDLWKPFAEVFISLPIEEAISNSAAAPPREVVQVVEHLFRHEAGKLVATLTGIFGIEHLNLAEGVAQEIGLTT